MHCFMLILTHILITYPLFFFFLKQRDTFRQYKTMPYFCWCAKIIPITEEEEIFLINPTTKKPIFKKAKHKYKMW